jgi:hypothetical protein
MPKVSYSQSDRTACDPASQPGGDLWRDEGDPQAGKATSRLISPEFPIGKIFVGKFWEFGPHRAFSACPLCIHVWLCLVARSANAAIASLQNPSAIPVAATRLPAPYGARRSTPDA